MVLAVLGAVACAPAGAAPAGTLLVVTETAGYRHTGAIAQGRIELRREARERGLRYVEVTRFRDLTPERYAAARALVLLQTSGDPELSADGRARLLGAVDGGLPLLAFHAAADTFKGWTAFHQRFGATFRDHPNVGVGRIVVEDPTPALRASYRAREEFYRFRTSPRPRVHVLASLDVASVGGRPAGDRPLVWWRGNVFYSALGHAGATWRTVRHRRLVHGALDRALARTP